MGACLAHYFYIICILGHCFIREFRWLFKGHNDFFLKVSGLIFGLSRGPVFQSNMNPRHHPTTVSSQHHLAQCLAFITSLILDQLLLPLSVPNPDCGPYPSMDLDLALLAYPH